MSNMSISLPPGLRAFVREQVETGTYSTASDVIQEGLRHLKRLVDAQQAILRHEIGLGLADMHAGQYKSFDSVEDWFADIEASKPETNIKTKKRAASRKRSAT